MKAKDSIELRVKLQRNDFTLNVDVALPNRGICVLFGPSGSGKTTFLRCVAGLERPNQALVRVGSEVWQNDEQGHFLPTWKRNLGYVFQEPSLFEHMNVLGNLNYGLKRSPQPGAIEVLQKSIHLLGIESLLHRRPATLSGGERQRVAIVRALTKQPRLLLLDEPLAALDMARRQEVMPWLEKMRDELSIPMLYVTHSIEELTRLADHLLILSKGQVKISGTTQDVLANPETSVLLAEDAGVVWEGKIALIDDQWQLAQLRFPGGSVWVRNNGFALHQHVRFRVLARDVSITLDEPQNTSIQNHLQVQVRCLMKDHHPSQAIVQLQCGDSLLLARLTRRAVYDLSLREGLQVWAQVKSVAVVA